MSRSRKKYPIGPITCRGCRPGREKAYKRMAHRAFRRVTRAVLKRDFLDEEILPHDKEFGDPWMGPKDGKSGWPRGGISRCEKKWFRK